MNIIQSVISENMKSRTHVKIVPKRITIHETDNYSKTANAQSHATYLTKNNTSNTSWHYTVDDKDIIQHLSIYEEAYHAGNSQGNLTSIGIEMCVCEGMDLNKVRENTIQLVVYLCKNYNFKIENVVQHYFWTKKDCPKLLRKEGKWEWFINEIGNRLAGKDVEQTDNKSANILNIDILALQKFLNSQGITDYENKKLVEDGFKGKRTKSAVEKLLNIL